MSSLTQAQLEEQLSRLNKGFPYIRLERPLLPQKDVYLPTPKDEAKWVETYEREAPRLKVEVFVPASGMATRMFRSMQELLRTGIPNEEASLCFQHLNKMPFYVELKGVMESVGLGIESLLRDRDYSEVARYLLTSKGLNYAATPKWELPFHSYPDGVRPCWLEHLREASLYASDQEGSVRLHATLRADASKLFVEKSVSRLSGMRGPGRRFLLSYSYQDPSTHSLSVYEDGSIVRDVGGDILWRPSGHGALLRNLEELDSDLVFIKNVDNIQVEPRHTYTSYYQKVLGGRALGLLSELRLLQERLRSDPDEELCSLAYAFIEKSFLISQHPCPMEGVSIEARVSYLQDRLDRPLRVCGLICSRKGSGGAALICRQADGSLAPQIVEPPQVDYGDVSQGALFSEALYLNPVNMVCIMHNEVGEKYDLTRLRDPETGLITEKSYQGKSIRVQEWPGLWNGSMSLWNTSFVEIPEKTFAAVKQLSDLLSPAHQEK